MMARPRPFRLALVSAALAASFVIGRPASAQPRLEITGSGAWWDGYRLGERRASITGPQAPTGSPVTLFDSDVAILPGAGAELRIGWRLFRDVYAEATGGLGVHDVEARITNDIEDAASATVSSSLAQITIEGGAVVELSRLAMSDGKLVPFIGAGGGYLRQVHEDRVLIETGRTVYAGAGVKWRATARQPRGVGQRLLLRADARLVSRSGGVDIEDARHTYITVSAGLGLRLF